MLNYNEIAAMQRFGRTDDASEAFREAACAMGLGTH